MDITTEEGMNSLCEIVNSLQKPFDILIRDSVSRESVRKWEYQNNQAIANGLISERSHLQQGITDFYTDRNKKELRFKETPFLYPSPQILKITHLIGPITGNLSNCYDPTSQDFLFQMRGRSISEPFKFQAAAAGMGKFREHPLVTATRELQEEAGIFDAECLFLHRAIDCLPFMKSGKVPQPLFSYGFAADLLHFPRLDSLDAIAEFEAKTKQQIEKSGEQKESYHFKISRSKVEQITGQLDEQQRFYGPVYQSTIDFIRELKNFGELK